MTVALFLVLAAGCADSPTAPSAPALVTLQVAGEEFRIQLNSQDQVAAARRAQQGGPARIPNGRIVLGTNENSGWSWHLEDVRSRRSRSSCAMAGRPTWSVKGLSSVVVASALGVRASYQSLRTE